MASRKKISIVVTASEVDLIGRPPGLFCTIRYRSVVLKFMPGAQCNDSHSLSKKPSFIAIHRGLPFSLLPFTMFSLPRSRRWVLPALALLVFVLVYRSIIQVPASAKAVLHLRARPRMQYGVEIPQIPTNEQSVPFRNSLQVYHWPAQKYYYSYSSSSNRQASPCLESLLRCSKKPNLYTNHIRLPNIVQNISQLISTDFSETKQHFNPTIIPLPPWSRHQYLLVSRVVTEGLHQESLMCEADTCHSNTSSEQRRPGERECTTDDLSILGPSGGLRCATEPEIISIPPTPAEKCEGSWSSFPNIPGFHDPRIFWSGRGEPLIMVNSASRYACVGLWIIDLRALYRPLGNLLASQPGQPYHRGPLMSYPFLTELTRNPALTRAAVEKNWFLFFPSPEEAFVHYDLSTSRVVKGEEEDDDHGRRVKNNVNISTGGRTFAKLIGNGLTTPNLTDPNEVPCLPATPDSKHRHGRWHQASNALKLILCSRTEAERGSCGEEQQREGRGRGGRSGGAVHFAVMHRKFSNEFDLPLRYERFFIVWDGRPPFHVLGVSRFPVLMWNETATGWDREENWAAQSTADHEPLFDHRDGHQENSSSPSASKDQGEDPATSTLQRRERTARKDNTTFAATNDTSETLNDGHQPANNVWAYFTYTPSIAWAFRPSPSIRRSRHPVSYHNDRYDARNVVQATNNLDNDRQQKDVEEEEGKEKEDGDQDLNGAEEDERSETGATDRTTGTNHHHDTFNAMNVGYLDDELMLGIGIDDLGQGFVRVRAEEALSCLRLCENIH